MKAKFLTAVLALSALTGPVAAQTIEGTAACIEARVKSWAMATEASPVEIRFTISDPVL